MEREIVGFVADDRGDWAAVLACHHRRHVRHRPPFLLAPWIEDEDARDQRIGSALDCPLCDRCELPTDLAVVRVTPTWDDATMPPALRRDHRVAAGTWALIHVTAGTLRFVAATDPVTDVVVTPGAAQAIPPDVAHHVEPAPATRFAIEFLAPEG